MEKSLTELSIAGLVEMIARALVDLPGQVSVHVTSNHAGTLLRLKVDPSDVGKIIGSEGRMTRSLRTILAAISVKLEHRYS